MSRLYIRLKTGFYSHRKTVRLRSRLGNDALWIPPRLWAYCAENQPDGDLSGYSAEEIAMLIAYQGDASSMLVALKDCQFLTSECAIWDWDEHNGYHFKYSERAKTAAEARWTKKEKNQKKESTERDKKGESGASIAQASPKHCLTDATSITLSKPTIDDVVSYAKEKSLSPLDGEYFFNHWESNGWTNGGRSIKDWKALIRAWKNAGHCPSQKQLNNKSYGNNKINSLNPAADRRSAGTVGNGTDWDAVYKRKEAERVAKLAGAKVEDATLPPTATGSP